MESPSLIDYSLHDIAEACNRCFEQKQLSRFKDHACSGSCLLAQKWKSFNRNNPSNLTQKSKEEYC